MPGFVSVPFTPSRPGFPALRVAGRPVWVSLALVGGTPFHAVCAFRGLGPGALLVFPACPIACVCTGALAASAPYSLPGLVSRAPRVVPVQGAGRAVPCGSCPSAFPASVPCAVWLALGGGRPGLVLPVPGLGLSAPLRPGLCVRDGPAPGGAGCREGGLCAALPGGVGGGPRGARGRSTSVRPSAFPGRAPQRVSLASSASFMEGVAFILLRFVFAC